MTTRTIATSIAFTFAVVVLAATAHGGTLTVANDGVDGPSCGGKKEPCRSIGRAITNAGAGDEIVVGPGHYGDLDDDGTLGEACSDGSGYSMRRIGTRCSATSRGSWTARWRQ